MTMATNGLEPQKSALGNFGQVLMNVLIILLCLGVFWFFLAFSGVNNNERALFADMLAGNAERPFVTRTLIPWLTKTIAGIIPASMHTTASETARTSSFFGGWLTHINIPAALALEGIISLLIQLGSLIGFAFAIKALLARVYKAPAFFASLATLTALLGLLPMLLFGYIYDLPNLFLCTLALFFIRTRKIAAYAIVFVLAIINKETAVVLIVPSVLLFLDFERPSLVKVCTAILAQIAVYLAVRLPINAAFKTNPGVAFEINLDEHLYVLVNHPVLWGISVLIGLGVIVLIFQNWREKPALAMLGALPMLPLIGLFVVSGFPFEIRVFYEVYAAGFLGLIFTLAGKKVPIQSKPPITGDGIKSLPQMFGRREKIK